MPRHLTELVVRDLNFIVEANNLRLSKTETQIMVLIQLVNSTSQLHVTLLQRRIHICHLLKLKTVADVKKIHAEWKTTEN